MLLLSNSNNSHYILIKNFNRFVTNKGLVLLPEEVEYVNFQNFKRLAKASFIIYVYFECLVIMIT